MFKTRKSNERGLTNWEWLTSFHSFSFGDYYDPQNIHFRALRVINEDTIAPTQGFDLHPHENMEIITFVTKGVLEHQDTLGNKTQIKPGEIQRMSAGQGIMHSEYNASKNTDTHLLQIWLLPKLKDITPSYAQKDFSTEMKSKDIVLLASKTGEQNSITINQDVNLYWVKTSEGKNNNFVLKKERHQWIQVVRGEVEVKGVVLESGDAMALSQEEELNIKGVQESEILLFDLE